MDTNRRISRDGWNRTNNVVTVPVQGKTQIYRGDLLFLDMVDGLRERGSSSADWYAYPFSKISGTTLSLASNKELAYDNFIGIASWHSDSGVTEDIHVFIEGLFSYPLKNARYVKPLYAVIPSGSGVTLYDQRVAIESGTTNTKIIGLATHKKQFASSVEFKVITYFQPQFRNIYFYNPSS